MMNEGIEVVGALPLRRVAGHQHDFHFGILLCDLKGKGNTVHPRHQNIRKQQIKRLRHQAIKGKQAILDGGDFVTAMRQGASNELPNGFFIFGYENASHFSNYRDKLRKEKNETTKDFLNRVPRNE